MSQTTPKNHSRHECEKTVKKWHQNHLNLRFGVPFWVPVGVLIPPVKVLFATWCAERALRVPLGRFLLYLWWILAELRIYWGGVGDPREFRSRVNGACCQPNGSAWPRGPSCHAIRRTTNLRPHNGPEAADKPHVKKTPFPMKNDHKKNKTIFSSTSERDRMTYMESVYAAETQPPLGARIT